MKQNLIVIGRSDGSILIQDALQSLQQSTLQRSIIDQSNSIYSTQESTPKSYKIFIFFESVWSFIGKFAIFEWEKALWKNKCNLSSRNVLSRKIWCWSYLACFRWFFSFSMVTITEMCTHIIFQPFSTRTTFRNLSSKVMVFGFETK